MVAVLYGLGVFHGRPTPAIASTDSAAAAPPVAPEVAVRGPRAEPARRRPGRRSGASPATLPARKEVSAKSPPLPADPRTDTLATRAAIDVVIRFFREAIESRDLARVTIAYPGMTVKQQQQFADLFQKAENLRMTLVVEKLNKLTANSADVTLRGSYQYTDRISHRNKLDDYKAKATLAFAAGSWRLSEIH